MSSFVERYTGTFTATKDKNGEVVVDKSTVTLSPIGENSKGTANGVVGNGVVGKDAVNPTTNSIGQGVVVSQTSAVTNGADRNADAVINSSIDTIDRAVNTLDEVAKDPLKAGLNIISSIQSVFNTLNELFMKSDQIKTQFRRTYEAITQLQAVIERCSSAMQSLSTSGKNNNSNTPSNTTNTPDFFREFSNTIQDASQKLQTVSQNGDCLTIIPERIQNVQVAWKLDYENYKKLDTQTHGGGRNRRRKRSQKLQMKRSRIKKTHRRKSKKRAHTRTH